MVISDHILDGLVGDRIFDYLHLGVAQRNVYIELSRLFQAEHSALTSCVVGDVHEHAEVTGHEWCHATTSNAS